MEPLPRLPSHDPKAAHPQPPSAPPPPAVAPRDDEAPPHPIGPERLRALREAILNGTYPTEGAVTGGLVNLFRQPAPGPCAPGQAAPPAQGS
jgi:hypothetical protein